MMSMKYLPANEIVLVRYPFSDFTASKIRPAVVVSSPHISQDVFIVPLTSKTNHLLAGEFVLEHWDMAGLNVPSAVKRGIYTISKDLVIKILGKLQRRDASRLQESIRSWLN